MNTDRIKEIQQETPYPESVSVQQALLKVWNETEQEQLRIGAVSVLLLERAASLVGNPDTNISSSTDIACDEWQRDFERWRNER
jgi:hypothetical protein